MRSPAAPGAIMLRDDTAPLAADDAVTTSSAHVRGLGEKDLRFALELGDQLDVDLPLANWRFAPRRRPRCAAEGDTMTDRGRARRARGLEKMNEVYGWEIRPARRLLRRSPPTTCSATSGHGPSRCAAPAAADRCRGPRPRRHPRHPTGRGTGSANSTRTRCGRSSIFLAHYVGWPLGLRAERGVGRVAGSAEGRARVDKKATDDVRRHS